VTIILQSRGYFIVKFYANYTCIFQNKRWCLTVRPRLFSHDTKHSKSHITMKLTTLERVDYCHCHNGKKWIEIESRE